MLIRRAIASEIRVGDIYSVNAATGTERVSGLATTGSWRISILASYRYNSTVGKYLFTGGTDVSVKKAGIAGLSHFDVTSSSHRIMDGGEPCSSLQMVQSIWTDLMALPDFRIPLSKLKSIFLL